ncbi:MAG: AIR synthase-related protein [Chloroflexota bacterium]|nr:AIR synthase-related protein [Chloroflexota bacterium]
MADNDSFLPPGKLPHDLLSRLIGSYVISDPDVLIGPGVGRDAAAIRVGDRAIVVKTDPVTFATPDAGRYLVHVNANDIVCMGATPRWLLVTALLPEKATTAALVEDIFASLSTAATELGITLVGGHTEITIGLDRVILVGQMLGDADPARLLDVRRAEPGDAVLLCAGIAIEGTSILASEAAEQLTHLPPDLLISARRFLDSPGISVVPAARALLTSGAAIRGLHDPTEGGLASAVAELATAAGLGIEIDAASIPVYPETAAICTALDLDPLGLIASGALLAVVANSDAERALTTVRDAGINAARIGVMTDPESGHWIVRDGHRHPLPTFAADEIARYFASGQPSSGIEA